jgi:uncharacterized RDD family membrane protein YckC
MRWEAQTAPVGKNAGVTMYPSVPVAVPSGDPTAVVGRRIGAAIIDVVLVAAIGVVMFLVNHDTLDRSEFGGVLDDLECSDADTNLCFESGDTIYYAEGGKAGAIYGVSILAFVANHILLQGATGASVGKHLLGLRVIKKDNGAPAKFGANILRELAGIADRICCYLPGLIMVLAVKGHRRLGDMAAGTLVVGTESVGIPPVVPGLTSPQFSGSPYATSYPPSSPMSPPQAASPTSWPPPSPAASAPTPPRAESGAPATNTPTWDPQRNTYVIFDAAQNQWMQWDETSQQWRPIS